MTSILGRFLEHSRIYCFHNGGSPEVYLGSADLMPRNLDRRVEELFPVTDPTLRASLYDELLPTYLRDTVNTRVLRADGSYVHAVPAEGQPPFDIQAYLMALANAS